MPTSGKQATETMPADACPFFYDRTVASGAVLRPKDGDCCMFCSYGSMLRPSIQQERTGGTAARFCEPRGPGVRNSTEAPDPTGLCKLPAPERWQICIRWRL
ncbi:GDCCVxC domain-containing (seleno)protein [Ensifer adhaerens]|uniref:GDCCVxC domain-containing (seleno)protein n=1 Tax=Ensifer adhaerens TaxID=106592 RepID=UPI003B82C7A3